MTEFIKSLIDFLLIHESLIITNFLILEITLFYERNFNYNNFEQNENNNIRNFPYICNYLNSINNM